MHKRGHHSFQAKIFVSQCQNFSWASLQGFRKVGVSKNVMHKRGITIFRRKFLRSHSAEKIREQPFNVSKNLGYRKIVLNPLPGVDSCFTLLKTAVFWRSDKKLRCMDHNLFGLVERIFSIFQLLLF